MVCVLLVHFFFCFFFVFFVVVVVFLLLFFFFCFLFCACFLSFFSSSWCRGLAAVCDCGTHWTFIVTFLEFKKYV